LTPDPPFEIFRPQQRIRHRHWIIPDCLMMRPELT